MPFPPARCGRISCTIASLSGDQRSITHWFDTSAFAAPAQFTFGNSPRSGLRGAPVVTTDVTLEKSLRLNEKFKFDLRGEFYNILNHANFNVPGATFGAADFGLGHQCARGTRSAVGRPVELLNRLTNSANHPKVDRVWSISKDTDTKAPSL